MKISTLALGCCLFLASGCFSSIPPSNSTVENEETAQRCVEVSAADPEGIVALRNSGQPGLDSLLASNAALIKEMREGRIPLDDPRATALRSTIDAVARQRDAHASGLYWYTDLEAAKAEAARSGRHILSLRLLGNLDEEYSCANSRFFRTVLYANAEVSEHLRRHYVLHWKSVRPAPLVTIDMGDGRRIKRTITGNSIHYVLDADGTVLDALPGLHGPRHFLAALQRSEKLSGSNAESLRIWHGIQADVLRRQWLFDAVRAGIYGNELAERANQGELTEVSAWMAYAFPTRQPHEVSDTGPKPVAPPPVRRKPTEFEPRAIAKSMVERPISRQTRPGSEAQNATPQTTVEPLTPPQGLPPELGQPSLAQRMTNQWWEKLGELNVDDCRLDESSRRLMMAKLVRESVSVKERAAGGVVDEHTPFARTLRRFEAAIAQDTIRNEYQFHIQIHQWLEEDQGDRFRHDVEALNKRVYAELFLTPDYDAWLGLVPEDTYTALEKDGCACDKGAPPMK